MTVHTFAVVPRFRRVSLVLGLACALAALEPLHAQDAPPWPETFTARLEALAMIQTLNAEILGSRSATLTLENWCRSHRLAEEPRILRGR